MVLAHLNRWNLRYIIHLAIFLSRILPIDFGREAVIMTRRRRIIIIITSIIALILYNSIQIRTCSSNRLSCVK